jgi:hypothetical protein
MAAAFGAEVYRKSTGDSVLGKSAGKEPPHCKSAQARMPSGFAYILVLLVCPGRMIHVLVLYRW